jgi:hypothetical protein
MNFFQAGKIAFKSPPATSCFNKYSSELHTRIETICYHSGLIRDLKTSHIQIISTLLDLIEHPLSLR